jgi:glycine/D-amino acid oxidase-like deaminating enzyme
VRILDEDETHECIGTSIYRKALYFEEGGALNPFAYAVGLAETVRDMGVPIFVDSPVERVEKADQCWRISTARGAIEANRVVLAANSGNFRLHPSLQNVSVPMAVSEYATRTMTSEETRRNLGRALPYTDRQPYMFTARLDHESRIISALPGLLGSRKLDEFLAEVAERFRRVYPDLEDPRVEYIWQGIAYLNRDLLPAIYAPEGSLDLLAINACNGRGIAVNTAIGQEIASLIQSGDETASAIPITVPKRIPFYPVARHVPAMLMTISRAGDRLRQYRTSKH